MKSAKLVCITAIVLFAAFVVPTGLAAQDKHNDHMHHHYKLIDLGTFGGPQSYSGVLPAVNPVVNEQGVAIAYADTPTPDPFPAFCFDPDCFVPHAFQWQNANLTDLAPLAAPWRRHPFWIRLN